jgi:hypothetical protein
VEVVMPKTYKSYDEWHSKFKEHLAAKPKKPPVTNAATPQMPLAPGPPPGRSYKRYGEK